MRLFSALLNAAETGTDMSGFFRPGKRAIHFSDFWRAYMNSVYLHWCRSRTVDCKIRVGKMTFPYMRKLHKLLSSNVTRLQVQQSHTPVEGLACGI